MLGPCFLLVSKRWVYTFHWVRWWHNLIQMSPSKFSLPPLSYFMHNIKHNCTYHLVVWWFYFSVNWNRVSCGSLQTLNTVILSEQQRPGILFCLIRQNWMSTGLISFGYWYTTRNSIHGVVLSNINLVIMIMSWKSKAIGSGENVEVQFSCDLRTNSEMGTLMFLLVWFGGCVRFSFWPHLKRTSSRGITDSPLSWNRCRSTWTVPNASTAPHRTPRQALSSGWDDFHFCLSACLSVWALFIARPLHLKWKKKILSCLSPSPSPALSSPLHLCSLCWTFSGSLSLSLVLPLFAVVALHSLLSLAFCLSLSLSLYVWILTLQRQTFTVCLWPVSPEVMNFLVNKHLTKLVAHAQRPAANCNYGARFYSLGLGVLRSTAKHAVLLYGLPSHDSWITRGFEWIWWFLTNKCVWLLRDPNGTLSWLWSATCISDDSVSVRAAAHKDITVAHVVSRFRLKCESCQLSVSVHAATRRGRICS